MKTLTKGIFISALILAAAIALAPVQSTQATSAQPSPQATTLDRNIGQFNPSGGSNAAIAIASTAVITDDQVCGVTKYGGNPVLSVGTTGQWDSILVFDPSVVNDNGTYRMWYQGAGSGGTRIGYATSADGVNWTKSGSNPVLAPSAGWEGNHVGAPSVISDTGTFKMWYAGIDSNGIGRIGYVTSTDGIAWTIALPNPVLDVGLSGNWDANSVAEPNVIKVGSTYHMWYVGSDGTTTRIGHATSADGVNWTKDGANPILDIGTPGDWDWLGVYGPSIIQYNGYYLMWYSGQTLPAAWATGFADSSNGSTWTRKARLIAQGNASAFDDGSADYASTLVEGNTFKTWYSGYNNSSGTYNIGYATASNCAYPSFTVTNRVYLPLVLKSNPLPPCQAYYADSFSDPNSGWYVNDNTDRKYAYLSGTYQVVVKNAYSEWSVTAGALATDYTVAVSARRASGTTGAYGIEFGINADWNQFYDVLIDANQYSIWRYNTGTWAALKNWTTSANIATGTNSNRLTVVRNGTAISVYVNGHFLTTVNDGTLTGLRRVGLVVSSDSTAVDARFDDFAMYTASCGVSATDVQAAPSGLRASGIQPAVLLPEVPNILSGHAQKINPK